MTSSHLLDAVSILLTLGIAVGISRWFHPATFSFNVSMGITLLLIVECTWFVLSRR